MNKATALLAMLPTLLFPALAHAAEATAPGRDTFAVAAVCLGFGLAILGGALGQGRAAAAAYDGICRNPGAAKQVFTPLLIGLSLIESLVILGFVGLNVIAFA